MSIRRRVVAHGRVQGVFFRDATRRRAETRGVAGWVEAVFEGEPDAVESMVRFTREGPGRARVDDLEVVEEEPEGLSGFSVR